MEKQYDKNVFNEFEKFPLLEITENWESSLAIKIKHAKRRSNSKGLSITQLPVLLVSFLLLNGMLFYTFQKKDNPATDSRQEVLQHLSDELLINATIKN